MKRFVVVAAVSALGLSSSSCGKPAEAPTGIEDLTRFIWDRFDAPDDAGLRATQELEIQEAMANLDAELANLETPLTVDTPFKNVLEDLDEERVASLEGMAERTDKMSLAQGLVIADVITGCTLEQLENLTLATNSEEIHPGVYESYSKVFDDDDQVQAFDDGEVDTLAWRTTYGAQPVPGSAYEATTRIGYRRVKPNENAQFGDVLISRVHLPEPAVFSEGADSSFFDLDFQFETYHERDDQIIHFYPMWRRMKLGIVDSSQDAFITFSLDNMVEWDKQLEKSCAEGFAD